MELTNPSFPAKFMERRPDSTDDILSWMDSVRSANWHTPHELRADWPGMKSLREGRYAFKIRGNHYRLVAFFDFVRQRVEIRFIGTHAEFDRKKNKEY